MTILTRKIVFAAVLAELFLTASTLKAAMPSWDQVKKIVEQQLNSMNDYQPGDLISRRQVDPAFDLLQRAGWTVPDRVQILGLVCADNDAIVRKLRTSNG